MYSKAGAGRLVGVDSFRIRNPDHIQVGNNTGYQDCSSIGGRQGQKRPRKVQWRSEIFKFKYCSNWNEIVVSILFTGSDDEFRIPNSDFNFSISTLVFFFFEYINQSAKLLRMKIHKNEIWNLLLDLMNS